MPKSVTSYFPAFLVMGSFRKSGTPDIDPVTYQIPEVRHAQYPRSKDIFQIESLSNSPKEPWHGSSGSPASRPSLEG